MQLLDLVTGKEEHDDDEGGGQVGWARGTIGTVRDERGELRNKTSYHHKLLHFRHQRD